MEGIVRRGILRMLIKLTQSEDSVIRNVALKVIVKGKIDRLGKELGMIGDISLNKISKLNDAEKRE